MLSFTFVIALGFLNESESTQVLYSLFISNIVVGHPIIRRGGDPINRFNFATFLCMSHVRIWISTPYFRGFFSNAICRGLFVLSDLKRVRFVGIGEIVDNRCLNFLFIILLTCVTIIFNDRELVRLIIIGKSKVS